MTKVYTSFPRPGAHFLGQCNGMDEDFSEVLLSYTISNTGASHTHWIVIGVSVFLQHVEGFIYFVIFLHVYRHEKTVVHLLTEKTLKYRRKQNVLTFNSMFYLYVMEQIYIYLFLLKPTTKSTLKSSKGITEGYFKGSLRLS